VLHSAYRLQGREPLDPLALRTTASHGHIPLRVDLAAQKTRGEQMQHTRLSTYDLTKGTFDELTDIVEKGLLPTFVKEPGFVNYGLVDAGDHKVVSISIWQTREQAQKSATMATTWVQANVADRVRLLTTQIGDLALFRGMPVAV
jgi:hypothetical protein